MIKSIKGFYEIEQDTSFGLRVLSLPGSVCVCVCLSVCQSLACPRDNSGPVDDLMPEMCGCFWTYPYLYLLSGKYMCNRSKQSHSESFSYDQQDVTYRWPAIKRFPYCAALDIYIYIQYTDMLLVVNWIPLIIWYDWVSIGISIYITIAINKTLCTCTISTFIIIFEIINHLYSLGPSHQVMLFSDTWLPEHHIQDDNFTESVTNNKEVQI